MNNIFSLDSPLINMLRLFADLMILNLLWLLGCIPIFTIGASTTALYQAIIKIRKEGSIPLWSDFWRFFCSNFKQATILFFVVVVVAALAVSSSWFIPTQIADTENLTKYILLLPILLVVLPLGYVFPLQAQFENSIINTLKNAWGMSCIHLIVSVVVMILNLLPVIVFLLSPKLFFQCVPIWICLAGALIAYINTVLLQRVFKKYIPAEDIQS